MARWTLNIELDNERKPIKVWTLGDYELSKNANEGNDGGWKYELTRAGRRVGLFDSVALGQEAVRELDDGASPGPEPAVDDDSSPSPGRPAVDTVTGAECDQDPAIDGSCV